MPLLPDDATGGDVRSRCSQHVIDGYRYVQRIAEGAAKILEDCDRRQRDQDAAGAQARCDCLWVDRASARKNALWCAIVATRRWQKHLHWRQLFKWNVVAVKVPEVFEHLLSEFATAKHDGLPRAASWRATVTTKAPSG